MGPRLFAGELIDRYRAVLVGLALLSGAPVVAATTCQSSGPVTSVRELAERVQREGVRFVFIGEEHGAWAPKRFAVELLDRLTASGLDAGLYVEGFRTDCRPFTGGCRDLARLFNPQAFGYLLSEVGVKVHPIGPPGRDRRVERMATAIAEGHETVRVVLVGRTHVVHAGDPHAVHWVFGGGMSYPDPGDLAEAFPREASLTVVLDDDADVWELRGDGCRADYLLAAGPSRGGSGGVRALAGSTAATPLP